MDVTVRRENDEISIVAVHEEGHEEAVLTARRCLRVGCRHLLGILKRRLVPVMPVGDQQRRASDAGRDRVDRLTPADPCQKVMNAIGGSELRQRLRRVERRIELRLEDRGRA